MAIIIELLICQTCHNKIKNGMEYTHWEGSIYCENCFDKYLELIEPNTWESSKFGKDVVTDD